MNIHEIRERYLSFFEKQGHARVGASSLLPENDPTTLFTGSGMQPMVPYLLGEEHPQGRRVCNSQPCFRAQDIEEVGDASHTTFFEMLGNWSFGDYFKNEQIPWMFTFLTKELGLDPSRLYVTVYAGNTDLKIEKDTDSIALWQKQFQSVGIEAPVVENPLQEGMNGRIFVYGEEKNWWSRSGVPLNMPPGEPGGPDTEMFWDFGEHLGLHEASGIETVCHPNCDCGRFVEIGNNVFMQVQKTSSGFAPLAQVNVDFGGGLERLAAAMANHPDVFTLNLFDSALKVIEKKSDTSYHDPSYTYAFRVILDHIRAALFLIADGALPSNKDQGYFVRRLVRRAVRFGKRLGVSDLFVHDVARAFITEYQIAFPALTKKAQIILEALENEERKFRKTLEKGEKIFSKIYQKKGKIDGEDAFLLYATYGFPLELTREMAKEQGQVIDESAFCCEFEKHQVQSRAGSEQKFKGGLVDDSEQTKKLHTATHLLHQALRTVLGDHVAQKGSNITAERLRFDFTHSQKMTEKELKTVEAIVNEQIHKALPILCESMPVERAREKGAIGLFEDKYKDLDTVKVYTVGDKKLGVFSQEICGGPHVQNTSELGRFNIKKEEGSSAGVRRIKAILE